MDIDTIDVDEPGTLKWLLVPERPVSGHLFGGTGQDFESIRNAVHYWATKLPPQQRSTAWIARDGQPDIDADHIQLLYDVVRKG